MTATEAHALLASLPEGASPGPWANVGYPLRGIDGPEIMGPGDQLLCTLDNHPNDAADALEKGCERKDAATQGLEEAEAELDAAGWDVSESDDAKGEALEALKAAEEALEEAEAEEVEDGE